jgi:hypothetical protein
MTTITPKFDYNLDKAINLLGPINQSYKLKGISNNLLLTIQHFIKTFFRVINFIFGDHHWYNNKKAEEILIKYYNSPQNYPQIAQKIEDLYVALENRSDSFFYTSNEFGFSHVRTAHDNFWDSQPKPGIGEPKPLVNGLSSSNRNDLLSNKVEEDLNSFTKVQAKPRMVYPIGVRHSIAINGKEDLYNYQVRLLPKDQASPEEAKKAYDQLLASLAPRKVPISETNINNRFDPRYASAYDPCELFAQAVWIVMKEHDLKDFHYRGFCLSGSFYYIKKAVSNLILQAEIRTEACNTHGGEYLNINNNAMNETRYQKPILTYQASTNGVYKPKVLFQTDLFSSTQVGCDPVGAKRLMDKLQLDNKQDQIALNDLVQTMANQVMDRYGKKIVKMIQNSNSSTFKSTANSLKNITTYYHIRLAADTPYQLILYTFIMRAQKLASAGLINDNELSNAKSLDSIGKIVCSETLLKILYSATIKDNFTVSLSPNIDLACGKIIAHEPSEENPNILVATEHFIAHALSGTGTIDDPSTDLIYIVSMLSKLSTDDKKLFFKFYPINYLKNLYALKEIPEDKMIDVNKTQEIFDQLTQEKRESFLKLANDLEGLLHILYEKYFKKMYGPIWEQLELEENPLPTILKLEKKLPVIFEDQIEQEIQFKYLDAEFHDKVIFDKQPICDKPPKILFDSWDEVPGNNNSQKMYMGVLKQNAATKNLSGFSNCMYGALSLVIFGSNANSYCSQLRKAAGNYMLDHKNEFATSMIDGLAEMHVYQKIGEPEKKYSKRIQPILEDLLLKHCEKIQNAYVCGTDRELSAIAAIFGVEIQVFNASAVSELQPIVNGIIPPNSIMGDIYKGKPPIKLLLHQKHFEPLTRITE